MEISSTPCTLIEVRRGEPLLVEQLKQQVVMLEYGAGRVTSLQ